MRDIKPTPWRLLRSLQAVLWAVLVLCVGNALACRTVNPLDLPQADTADTAKTRAVALAKSAEILALEEMAESAETDVGEELRTPYSYVGNAPLVGVDPTGMIDLGNGQPTISAPSPGEIQPLSFLGWQWDNNRDRAIGLIDGSPLAIHPAWIAFHPEVIDEKRHQEAAVTAMVLSLGVSQVAELASAKSAPRFSTWNEFQAGTKGEFTSRSSAAAAWSAYKVEFNLATEVARSSSVRSEFLRSLAGSDRVGSWMMPWLKAGKVPPGFEVHHRVPLSVGGADATSNMQLQGIDLHAIHHQFSHPWR